MLYNKNNNNDKSTLIYIVKKGIVYDDEQNARDKNLMLK